MERTTPQTPNPIGPRPGAPRANTSGVPGPGPGAPRPAGPGSGGPKPGGRPRRPPPTEKEWRSKRIGMIGGFLFMFIAPVFIPTWASVTEMGVAMLCTFIGIMFIFMLSNELVLGSMMGCIACMWHGYQTAADIYVNILGNSTAVQIMLLMCWGMLMKDSDGMQTLGRKLIRLSGRLRQYPLLFNILFFECMVFCACFTNALVFVVTVVPMFEGIAEAVGYKRTDRYYKIMMTGLIMIGCCLGSAKGVGGLALGVINVVSKGAAKVFPFTHDVFQFNLIVRGTAVIFVIVFVLMAKFVFRCDFSKLSDADIDGVPALRKENCILTREAKFLLVGFIVIMGRAYLPNPFPEAWKLASFYEELALPFVIMVFMIVFGCLKGSNGYPLTMVSASLAQLNWGVIWSIGAMTIIAGSFTSELTGLKPWLVGILSPIFEGRSYPVFCFLLLLFTCLLTNVMSNMGTAIIFGSVAVVFLEPFVDAGINPLPLIASIIGTAMIALFTYAGGPIAPMYLSRPEMDKKFVYTIGFGMNILYVLVFTVVAVAGGYILANPAL